MEWSNSRTERLLLLKIHLKNCFGLSGGIDSAVSAAIAVDAVGSENVIGVMMPSRYSSKESLTDAKNLQNY